MKYARHPEFPQFRSKLAAMKKVRRQVAAHRSLHSLEKTMARFLPAGLLQELGEMPGRRVRWLPMTLIFWVFLQMVLCPGSSCREAQRATQAWWRRQGRRWLNPNTNAFCQARARLPLAWLQKVWWRLADRICAQAPSLPGCHGRRMLVADGTTVQTPDTTSNQAQWPQVTSQQPGCGFPLVHLVGFFCLSSGALLRATNGAWKDHEMRLFALLRGTLRRGDVLVADRGFWSFANLAFLPLRGVDLIVRAKYANTLDWRQGQRLGKDDRLVTMSKPDDASRVILLFCALDQLPHRPGRHQPRAVKRRPKPYQLLTRHRRLFTESPSRQNKGKPRTKSKRHSTVLSA